MKNNYYYNIDDDLQEYPDIWCVIAIGGRNCGKTYSALKKMVLEKKKFVFLKRTIEDVDLLCSGNGRIGSKENEYSIDLSPFKSVNRDLGTDIKAYSIKKGIGGFFECIDDSPVGSPIGYLLSLSAVSRFKGFDLSECDYLIFDEFIPQPWDRVNRKEGEQLLDLYKTVSRDREHRGREPLKLLCLANATNISNPVCNILEITDTIAEMESVDEEYNYDSDRGILIHIIKDNPEFTKKEKSSHIYKAMGNTAWGRMAFDNEFGYNDFSNIGRMSIKGCKPVCSFSYKNDNYYIYIKDGYYYLTHSRHNSDKIYNLNKENDQKKFYYDYIIDFRNECIEGNFLFETYTMYDIVINYKSLFKI